MTEESFEARRAAAIALATRAHQGQRYNEHPYTIHLEAVEAVLRRFGTDPDDPDPERRGVSQDLLIAAWLHDVLEDTDVKPEVIEARFGARCLALVDAVTNEEGKNRAARHAKTYPKTRALVEGVRLKLADRIANVEACVATGSSLLGMYRKEWREFRQQLQRSGEHAEMWAHLSRLMRRGR